MEKLKGEKWCEPCLTNYGTKSPFNFCPKCGKRLEVFGAKKEPDVVDGISRAQLDAYEEKVLKSWDEAMKEAEKGD